MCVCGCVFVRIKARVNMPDTHVFQHSFSHLSFQPRSSRILQFKGFLHCFWWRSWSEVWLRLWLHGSTLWNEHARSCCDCHSGVFHHFCNHGVHLSPVQETRTAGAISKRASWKAPASKLCCECVCLCVCLCVCVCVCVFVGNRIKNMRVASLFSFFLSFPPPPHLGIANRACRAWKVLQNWPYRSQICQENWCRWQRRRYIIQNKKRNRNLVC